MFQELTLLPWMTVAENLLHRARAAPALRPDRPRPHGRARRRRCSLASACGHIDPRALVEDISLAKRQIVEIVRVVAARARQILFLDEPTSSLVEREVDWLFGRIRELGAQGDCVVFTSHRWNEITSIADRITVFRNGADVGTFTEMDESRSGHA